LAVVCLGVFFTLEVLSRLGGTGHHDGINQESHPTGTRLLTELRGRLASRREYDLWLIENASNVIGKESSQEKIFAYCAITVHGAEHTLDSAPKTEYAIQPDGTLVITAGGPQKTPEQIFRDSQRMQLELDTGGVPVQECAGSMTWFRTWHDKPMPSDEQFTEIVNKAKADIETIDKMLDPRLVEGLPR